jgi:hypothetical protein
MCLSIAPASTRPVKLKASALIKMHFLMALREKSWGELAFADFDRPSAEREQFLVRINTQLMVNREQQVLQRKRVAGWFCASRVTGTLELTACKTAAGDNH